LGYGQALAASRVERGIKRITTPMTPERWQEIRGLLEQALELEPDQRSAFLDRICASDQFLRQEVEALLDPSDEAISGFLQAAPLAVGLSDVLIANRQGVVSPDLLQPRLPQTGVLQAGQQFAERFQLVCKLGEGGMGQVWLADQTSPVRRQVALKLIKAGMYDEAVVQRFQAERQSLAIMDHPAISKVFDAGTTPQGQPYFVMEYVPGLPITEYCDQRKLKISDRLELFIQACEGVQHAHQKAIIHRDLKPANILVVEVDGKPVPRIIDFGLAKATTPRAAGETLFTQLGHFMGTPGYMSPEQADPAVQDIDTRTDVYSLGIVLYVLLAGTQPFETRQEKQPLDELLRKLREEEPPRPSTKVGANRDTSTATAEARSTEPGELVSLLRGDLDWITMKALEKDRARRYGTPSELAADIRRYLNHEPIVARPASTGYRLRKYARRHRLAVIVAAALMLLLAAFSVLQALQLRRTTLERDRANRERDRATRITDFMTRMFKVSDPSEARGNSVTAREILDKASKDMGTGLAKDPEVQSQMMQVMASTYLNLGLHTRAQELAKSALDARLSRFGPDDPKTLESMTQLGSILAIEGHYPEGEKLERQALEGQRRILGPEDPHTLLTMNRLAITLSVSGHYDEAEKLEREVIEVGTRTLGPESENVLEAMATLGNILWFQDRLAEAEQEHRQLLEVKRRVSGPDHPETLTVMSNLAAVMLTQGRFAEAEQMYRETVAIAQRVLGPEHPATIRFLYDLAGALLTEHRPADAEKLYREVLANQIRTLGREHPITLHTQAELADDLFEEGRFSEAEKLQREVLATRLRVLGPEDPYTLASQGGLAGTLIQEGHYAEAERLARGDFEGMIRIAGPLHRGTLYALRQLVPALAGSGRSAEASKLYRDVMEKGQDSNSGGKGNPQWWYAFAGMAATTNHPEDALQYLREAINRGYKDADGLMADENLRSLRQNPGFQALVAELKRSPAKAQTQ
jgi:eukaryotic-like serine/threonine-protein kinase